MNQAPSNKNTTNFMLMRLKDVLTIGGMLWIAFSFLSDRYQSPRYLEAVIKQNSDKLEKLEIQETNLERVQAVQEARYEEILRQLNTLSTKMDKRR